MKKLFLFMAFLLGMNMTVGAQTASDSYLDMRNYASIDEAWDNSSITSFTKLYYYTPADNNQAWVSMQMYGAFLTSSQIGIAGRNQEWIDIPTGGDNKRYGDYSGVWNPVSPWFQGKSNYYGNKTAKSFGRVDGSTYFTTKYTISFFVTTVDQVKLFLNGGQNVSSSYPASLTIYEWNPTTKKTVGNAVFNQVFYTQNATTTITSSELDLQKVYKVECSTYRSALLEIAFRTPILAKIITNETSLDFSTTILSSQTKTFNVNGTDLQGLISATIVDENENEVTDGIFTVSPATISNENLPAEGVDVEVTFTPGSEEGTHTGYYLKLSTQSATDVMIPLTGEATNNTAIVANPASLTIATTVGTPKAGIINVKGIELHGNITATITGENGDLFSVTPTISMSDASAEDGVDVEITFDPDETGNAFTGTLTLSTPYAKQNVEIELKGEASSEYFPVTITSAGLSTLYLDFPVEIPYDNLDLLGVYYIHEKSGSELRATRLNKNIPANTGVIVQGNSGTYNFIRIKTADDLPRGTSLLSGCLEDTPASEITGGTVYTLGRGKESYINFFKYTGTKPLQANKAYYLLPSGNSAKALTLSFDDAESEVTGINTVGAKAENGAWYSIQGIQLQGKPATKGIYIHNGKAVIVK